MKHLRLISLFAGLLLLGLNVCAQNIKYGEKGTIGTTSKSSSSSTMMGGMIKSTGKMDAKTLPIEKDMQYNDGSLKELEKAMQERDWGSEDTAWERASAINTKESYQRYIGMYPYGAHCSAAKDKIVEIEVDDMLNNSHNQLPQMKHVEEDEDSPTSTIVVTNFTDYPLTVLYSGEDTQSVVISPGFTHTVTLKNGSYKIAASVPPAYIKPYAGKEQLVGGRYEVGYYVVSY